MLLCVQTKVNRPQKIFFTILFTVIIGFSSFSSFNESHAKQRKNAPSKNAILKQWSEGPVRYIINKEEEKIFRSFTSDAERSAFINRFWSRRDPSPGTPENEFRYQFWQRVIDANFLYAESSKPGWKTDRGKVHIIMGPPTEIEMDPNLSHLGSTAGDSFRGIIRWIYQGTGRTDLDPIVVVAFVRNPGGEYRLSSDPNLNSVFYDRLGSSYYPKIASVIQEYQQPSISELAVTLDLGRVQQLPPKEEVFSEIITDEQYFGAIPFKVNTAFYAAEEAEKTMIALTLALKKMDIPSYSLKISDVSKMYIIARFVDTKDQAVFYNFPEGSFTPGPFNDAAGENDFLHYQMKASVPPGQYTCLIGLFDSSSEFIGSSRETLIIPYIEGENLSISTLMLAEKIEQMESGAALYRNEPFLFGDLVVIPRLDTVLSKGDLLTVFYQIRAKVEKELPGDEPIGLNDIFLEGHYQFFGKSENGEYIKIGKPLPFEIVQPAQGEPLIVNQGRTFETKEWPTGSYKLTVMIRDRHTNRSVEQDIDFSVR